MRVAAFLRDYLRNARDSRGKARFQILDGGNTCCLPVVAARLNPELDLPYDDIDLQHALSESHWYVSGYALGFEDPCGSDEVLSLCKDAIPIDTMFRIVVKSNLTMSLAQLLKRHFMETLPILDGMQDGYRSMHAAKEAVEYELMFVNEASDKAKVSLDVVHAAQKWMGAAKTGLQKHIGYEAFEEEKKHIRRLSRISTRNLSESSQPSSRRKSTFTAC
jgi:hypothetical protein